MAILYWAGGFGCEKASKGYTIIFCAGGDFIFMHVNFVFGLNGSFLHIEVRQIDLD